MSQKIPELTGGCYCGSVRYRARSVDRDVVECHCSQCRKQSGHRYAGVRVAAGDVDIEGAEGITWFHASPDAGRGFCAKCGSHLFWRGTHDDHMVILAASVDTPDSLRMARHIFVDDKPGYYQIDDGLPQFKDYDTPVDGD